jgi:hypothetical protein
MNNQVSYEEKGRVIDNEYYDVRNGFLVIKESVVYNEEDNIIEEEVFEVNPNQASKKTHYKTQNTYEFYPEGRGEVTN